MERSDLVSKPTYSVDNFKNLKGTEAIRKRPGMYLGVNTDDDPQANTHGLTEVIDNSIDEYSAAPFKRIYVAFLKNGYIEVADEGRGIPVSDMEVDGKKYPACVASALFTHTGAKFDEDAYKTSGGLNGVGLTAVNAISEHFILITHRRNKKFKFECKFGKITSDLKETKEKTRTSKGTVIRFKIDKELMKHDHINLERIKSRLQVLSEINPGLKLIYSNEDTGEKQNYKANDISDHIKRVAKGKTMVSDVLSFGGIFEKSGIKPIDVQVSFGWSKSSEEYYHSVVNNITVDKGGTHYTGFRLALTKAISDCIKKYNLIPAKQKTLKITGDDVKDGLYSIVSIKISEPQFASQVKDRLGNSEAQAATQTMTSKFIKEYFEKNVEEAKKICKQIIINAMARQASKKARSKILEKNDFTAIAMASKLKECTSRDPRERELLIVEGKKKINAVALVKLL